MENSFSLSSSSVSAIEDTDGTYFSSSEADNESGSDLPTPASKKRKQVSLTACANRGAATCKTLYNSDWYPVCPANDNRYAHYCITCKNNVSCSHMGKADVKQHCETATHKTMGESHKIIKVTPFFCGFLYY